jgi:hypothetical protein
MARRLKQFFFSLQLRDRFWARSGSYPMGTGGSFPSSRGVKLTIHFDPALRLRIVELYLHFPIRLHDMVLN